MTTLTGEQIEELKQNASEHFWPHSRQTSDMFGDNGIQLVQKAKGVWVEDVDNKQWFDTLSSMWLVNIGHGRQEIAEAVYEQMTSVAYSPGGTVAPATAELAGRVASLAPDKESRVYFVSGGSEAVESALKMAKNYQRNVGESTRWKVISRRGSYHGATHACMSLGGGGISAPTNFGPLMPGNIHIEQPDGYRGRCCSSSGGCTLECARDLERAILHEGPSTVAAFIGEPISAAAGIHIPHPEYWATIREICDKYGVVMICDEVINAFGRTGKMFATEHWGVKPDITTVAKALTSGYLPIGAAIVTNEIADRFGSDEDHFRQALTFGGHPVSAAAALKNIDIIESENLVEHTSSVGKYLNDHLHNLMDQYQFIGDVRGIGLMQTIEFVKDRVTKESFDKSIGLGDKLTEKFRNQGLLLEASETMVSFTPPLCITNSEVDEIIQVVSSSLEETSKELSLQ